MSPIVKCPVCESEELTAKSETRTVQIPYAMPVPYKSTYFVCATCGEESSADEEEKAAATKRAITQSVNAMLDDLNARGISTAYLERALRIPQRTAARWKEGEVSAAAVALLRIIRTCPYLLQVADANFLSDGYPVSQSSATANAVLSVEGSGLVETKGAAQENQWSVQVQ